MNVDRVLLLPAGKIYLTQYSGSGTSGNEFDTTERRERTRVPVETSTHRLNKKQAETQRGTSKPGNYPCASFCVLAEAKAGQARPRSRPPPALVRPEACGAAGSDRCEIGRPRHGDAGGAARSAFGPPLLAFGLPSLTPAGVSPRPYALALFIFFSFVFRFPDQIPPFLVSVPTTFPLAAPPRGRSLSRSGFVQYTSHRRVWLQKYKRGKKGIRTHMAVPGLHRAAAVWRKRDRSRAGPPLRRSLCLSMCMCCLDRYVLLLFPVTAI